MKFLFMVPRYHTNLHYQVQALRQHGHTVTVLALYRGGAEEYGAARPTVLGYSRLFAWYVRFRGRGSGSRVKSSFELNYGFPPLVPWLRAVWRARPDVFVIKNIHNTYAFMGLAAAMLLRKKAVFLVQIPKYRAKRASASLRWLNRLYPCVAVTPVLGDRRYPNDNANLVYLPFPAPVAAAPRPARTAGPVRILCVGKFQERKGQLLLLEAVEQLRQQGNDITVTLIGTRDEAAYLERLRAYIDAGGRQAWVAVRADRSWQEVQAAYGQHDVFVLPSYAEAAAFAVVEAMAAGLPVVTSDDNGTQWYVEAGKNGAVFRHCDRDDLVRALAPLVTDPARINAMGARSLEIIRTVHAPERFYEDFMKVIS